jgi:ribA/ribD-fused uncharacterized protein
MTAPAIIDFHNTPLSNFAQVPHGVHIDGWHCNTVEHAYQIAKMLQPADRFQIYHHARTPAEAKRLGRKGVMRPDWGTARVPVMRGLLEQKFCPGTALAQALIDTGDAPLIEGNTWGDRFWGQVRGEGENWLGRLLMERREAVRPLHLAALQAHR